MVAVSCLEVVSLRSSSWGDWGLGSLGTGGEAPGPQEPKPQSPKSRYAG